MDVILDPVDLRTACHHEKERLKRCCQACETSRNSPPSTPPTINTERSLSNRDIFKTNRAAALAEWRSLCAEQGTHPCSKIDEFAFMRRNRCIARSRRRSGWWKFSALFVRRPNS